MALSSETWWIPAALWAVLYSSDLALTLLGQRLYRRLEGRFVRFDSYELTPFWRATVESGRGLLPRFAGMLLLSTALVACVGWLGTISKELDLTELSFGAMLLAEVAVHFRHVRNVFTFRALARGDSGVEGFVRYPLRFGYRLSAAELATFAVAYGAAFAVDGRLFWLGGAASTLCVSLQHLALSRRAENRETKAAVVQGN